MRWLEVFSGQCEQRWKKWPQRTKFCQLANRYEKLARSSCRRRVLVLIYTAFQVQPCGVYLKVSRQQQNRFDFHNKKALAHLVNLLFCFVIRSIKCVCINIYRREFDDIVATMIESDAKTYTRLKYSYCNQLFFPEKSECTFFWNEPNSDNHNDWKTKREKKNRTEDRNQSRMPHKIEAEIAHNPNACWASTDGVMAR